MVLVTCKLRITIGEMICCACRTTHFGVDKLAQPGAKTILVLGETAQIWAQNCINMGVKLHLYRQNLR